jgi:diacylglycerol kinase (ATP)
MERVVDLAVFVNPSAGRAGAGRKIGQVREAFSRRNCHARIAESGSRDEFRDDVRAAIEGGCTTLIAMGGDGTVQLLARECIGRAVRIGVIPAGGGNDFASALGISDDPEQAVAVIATGKTRMVDAVRVRIGDGIGQEAIYLGGGGMGLDAQAVRYASGKFLQWPGRLRYLASAVAALRGFTGVQLEAEFPDRERPKIAKRVLLAAALNTPTYGGGLRLAPAARVDDGILDVVIIEMLSKTEVLRLLPRLLLSGELETQQVERVQAAKIRLRALGETWFHGDGELLGLAPVEIEVMPKALCVLAP